MFGFAPFGTTPFCSLPGTAFVYPSGLSATGLVGSVDVATNSTVLLTGVQATGFIGNAISSVDSDVYVTGLQAVGRVGQVLLWGEIPTNQTPDWVPIND